ncbi:MAG: DUF58 domain-containing protein [Elusimicrobia bacterium]|nr:DUF58 domain-containing protein [Elusimicrobiota bacterium]
MKYLDPVALARLRNLELRMRRSASWAPAPGGHASVSRGLSHDFAQHRAYAPGDELRAIDWKVYGRQDRFYVKEFNEERMVTLQLLTDASGSMGFGSKWELACRLSMAVAYLAAAKGDAAGLTIFDTEPRRTVPARSGLGQLEALDAALAASSPGNETSLARSLEAAAGGLKRRALVAVVSDLLGDPGAVVSAVKALRARRHEVLVLQVLDPRERTLDYSGPVTFESLEDRSTLLVDADAIRPAYAAAFERCQKLFEAAFHGVGIAYGVFSTDVAWDLALGRFLSLR